MKNKLSDLNDHLFCQLERLNNEDLVGEKLDQELSRAKGMCEVARHVIDNGKLVLDAHVAVREGLKGLPQLIGPVETK